MEVGPRGSFTPWLEQKYVSITNTDFDLRFPKKWSDYTEQFDLIVAMEVLEHINEPISNRSKMSEIDCFRETGARNLLEGMLSASMKGGFLFLTTPNGASIEQIRKAVNGYTPIDYKLHVREYGWKEVVNLVKESGWSIDQVECIDCYEKFSTQAELDERKILRSKLSIPGQKLGRTAFVLAHKPA